jgi:hypothetical protein
MRVTCIICSLMICCSVSFTIPRAFFFLSCLEIFLFELDVRNGMGERDSFGACLFYTCMYIIRTKISIDRIERERERKKDGRLMRIYDDLQPVYIATTMAMEVNVLFTRSIWPLRRGGASSLIGEGAQRKSHLILRQNCKGRGFRN